MNNKDQISTMFDDSCSSRDCYTVKIIFRDGLWYYFLIILFFCFFFTFKAGQSFWKVTTWIILLAYSKFLQSFFMPFKFIIMNLPLLFGTYHWGDFLQLFLNSLVITPDLLRYYSISGLSKTFMRQLLIALHALK